MGGPSFPISAASTKKESNLQNLLITLTPNVRPKRIPKNGIEQQYTKRKTSEKPITEYFMLKDVWKCFKEWSAYGGGPEVILGNGEKVSQYFTPYLSALQISINKRIQRVDSLFNGSCNGTKSWRADNKSNELFRSSSNTSGNGKFSDSSSGSYSSTDPERKEIGLLINGRFEFQDNQNPYTRAPLFSKIQYLAKQNPGLLTLRSTDLSPHSWFAVAWYPIYHIPADKGVVKDLSAAFITFHKLSSFHEDAGVDPAHEEAGLGGSNSVMNKKGRKRVHGRIPLPPFGLAALNLKGDVWFINGDSDKEKYTDLYNAARSWLNDCHFYHHDFNFFANTHLRGG